MFSAFDRIIVINLVTRPDRRKETLKELNDHGCDTSKVRWFNATKPSKKPLNWANYTMGTWGCFQSHLRVLQDFLASDDQRMLVLEDDVHLVRTNITVPDADIVYFGALRREWYLRDDLPGWNALRYNDPITGLHCYGVTRNAARHLVEFLTTASMKQDGDPAGGPCHVDGMVSMCRAAKDISTCLFDPSAAVQRSSATDIHEDSWIDGVPVLRALKNIARKVKNALRAR